ncbi:FecR family protein [Negadavirga shengliensis]|uniref:FecR family protein n=1 Tax=Negadavirga shengliensis TaxID=1389218 RepID=A0ABV9T6N8_9BACT
MDISEYKVEDFVLDPDFKKWVLNPDRETNIIWEKCLEDYPEKVDQVKVAREILINLNVKTRKLQTADKEGLWRAISGKLEEEAPGVGPAAKTVPIGIQGTIRRIEKRVYISRQNHWAAKVASVALLVFALGAAFSLYFDKPLGEEKQLKPEVMVHATSPGVKSSLTLSDGTKVILNSGSKLSYVKNFSSGEREVFLEGEAFFDVYRDEARPFRVYTGEVVTTVLGTSFNVSTRDGEMISVALVSGKVSVKSSRSDTGEMLLEKGEMALVSTNDFSMKKKVFSEEQVIGWTKGMIVFDRTPMQEAFAILENWYGVEIVLAGNIPSSLVFSGKFKEETLANILRGLSYSWEFDYTIRDDQVKIHFK